MLERTIRSVAPDAVVAPGPAVVLTDARYYAYLSERVLRFLPVRLTPDDLARMHGTNERIGVSDYGTASRYYRQLMVNAAGRWDPRTAPSLPRSHPRAGDAEEG